MHKDHWDFVRPRKLQRIEARALEESIPAKEAKNTEGDIVLTLQLRDSNGEWGRKVRRESLSTRAHRDRLDILSVIDCKRGAPILHPRAEFNRRGEWKPGVVDY